MQLENHLLSNALLPASGIYEPDPSIYDSLDALDDYLSAIRLRREQRQKFRLEIERLQAAMRKVSAELEAAQEEEDVEIVLELQHVLQNFQERLQRLQSPRFQAVVSTTLTKAVEESSPRERPPEKAEEVITTEDRLEEVRLEEEILYEEVITEEELAALKRGWLTEIESLQVCWNELDEAGMRLKDQMLNRPACLRMRALACSLARIQVQAECAGKQSDIELAVTGLRDKMELARVYAGDTSSIPPFDPTFWTRDAERLTIEQWECLADLYTNLAGAQEAWEWYLQAQEAFGEGGKPALVNAIGAVQQMLFRDLDTYGVSDKLQGDLYGGLRDITRSVGFLRSLHADTSWDELEQMGQALPGLLARAKQEALAAQKKRDKETQKSSAIAAVVQWKQQYKVQPPTNYATMKAQTQLLPLLDACIAAGVPATNVEVRSALLDSANVLLQDLPQYAQFLEAVLTERRRRGLEAVLVTEAEGAEEEDLPDAHIAEFKEFVRVVSEDRKVLILGGSARPQVADKLKQMLRCASAVWLDSKKGDHMSKFKTDIARADIVIVIKKFASHEMTEKGRDWAKEHRKMFVLLPSGYGVNQIIHQMYCQLVQQDGGKKIDSLPLKAAVPALANLNLSLGEYNR